MTTEDAMRELGWDFENDEDYDLADAVERAILEGVDAVARIIIGGATLAEARESAAEIIALVEA